MPKETKVDDGHPEPEKAQMAPLVSFMTTKAVVGVDKPEDETGKECIQIIFAGECVGALETRTILISHEDAHRLSMALLESLKDHGCESAELLLEIIEDVFPDNDFGSEERELPHGTELPDEDEESDGEGWKESQGGEGSEEGS